MKVIAQNLGKRFNREWIFKGINFTSDVGGRYVILGPNGSGKSTLLQILTGITPASEGNLFFKMESKVVEVGEIYKHIALCAPYQDLIDEFTLMEMIDFHFKFKKCRVPKSALIEILDLKKSSQKFIGSFSSGMKQRLKVGLAIFSECDLLFLDEPCTNMDSKAIEWYQYQIREISSSTTVFIASNQSHEYPATSHPIDILAYK